MRHYETIFIINPDLTEEDTMIAVDRFTTIITNGSGEILKTDLWGRRRLAYNVKKFSKGFYVVMEYGANPEVVSELERIFKIDERVIRFLTIKKGEVFDPEALAKAQAEREAQIAARAAAKAAGLEDSDDDLDDDDLDEYSQIGDDEYDEGKER